MSRIRLETAKAMLEIGRRRGQGAEACRCKFAEIPVGGSVH